MLPSLCSILILIPIVMEETRTSVLLTRLAKKLRKETGDIRYRARAEDERASLKTLIFISCTRPIRMFILPCHLLNSKILTGLFSSLVHRTDHTLL